MSKPVSYPMRELLRKILAGRPDYMGGGPYMLSNTNSTAEALEVRGLIERAHSPEARRSLRFAWTITDAGRAELGVPK